MANNSLSSQQSLKYYGAIRAQVGAGARTPEVWQSVRAMADAMGEAKANVSVPDVSRMRGYAAAEVRAQGVLTGADPTSRIEGNMIGLHPAARDLGMRNLSPFYQARFLHTTADESGQLTAEYRTVKFSTMQMSVGEFRDRMERNAIALAQKYGTEHVGIDDLSITEI